MFYSPSKNTCYPPELRGDYEAAGTWPDDKVEISDELYRATFLECPDGKSVVPDINGMPSLIDTPPAPIMIPRVVTMRQARLALLQAGLLNDVEAAIAGLPTSDKEAAKIEWEYSQEVHRDRPFVASLANALGLSDAQLDDLFRLAATL